MYLVLVSGDCQGALMLDAWWFRCVGGRDVFIYIAFNLAMRVGPGNLVISVRHRMIRLILGVYNNNVDFGSF